MSDPRKLSDQCATQIRAAEVRRGWSPAERRRRTGLPPDAPWALLRKVLAPLRGHPRLLSDRGNPWHPQPVPSWR
jgi:hypothetical protein